MENHKLETDILEQALREKQFKLDLKKNELITMQNKKETTDKFVKLNAEMLQKSDE